MAFLDQLQSLLGGGQQGAPNYGAMPGATPVAPNGQSPAANVLARLNPQMRSTAGLVTQPGANPRGVTPPLVGGNMASAISGGVAAVNPHASKFGAFAQGLAGGLGARQTALQQGAQTDIARQTQTMNALKGLFDVQNKQQALQQSSAYQNGILSVRNQHENDLQKYQQGKLGNGQNSIMNARFIELARASASKRFGLTDPNFQYLSPEDQKARQAAFDAWDAQQPWNQAGGQPTAAGAAADGTSAGAAGDPDESEGGDEATQGTDANGDPDEETGTPAADPQTPVSDAGPVSTGSAAPVNSPAVTERPIRNSKTGELLWWNPQTGAMRPRQQDAQPSAPQQAAPAASPAQAPPQQMPPQQAAPQGQDFYSPMQ